MTSLENQVMPVLQQEILWKTHAVTQRDLESALSQLEPPQLTAFVTESSTNVASLSGSDVFAGTLNTYGGKFTSYESLHNLFGTGNTEARMAAYRTAYSKLSTNSSDKVFGDLLAQRPRASSHVHSFLMQQEEFHRDDTKTCLRWPVISFFLCDGKDFGFAPTWASSQGTANSPGLAVSTCVQPLG